jgi:hypothetical protein
MLFRVLVFVVLLAFLLPVFLSGCDRAQDTEEGEKVVVPIAIPPIDELAPAETETATFALG